MISIHSSMNPVGRLRPAGLRFILVGALVAGVAGHSSSLAADRPGPAADTFTFVPGADAYVDAAQPSTSFGSSSYLWVDASSVKQSFLRFDLSGITGRAVTGLRLRLYQTDSSPSGGNVWSITSADWDESVTWDTRPTIDGPLQGAFGSVQALAWYELGLDPSLASADGPLCLAVDSADNDGARWASREHAMQPQLIVELEPVESDSFTFTPEVDAYVDQSQPGASFGASSSLWVDASPLKQSFLRFDAVGIAGRAVTAARLRLRQTDSAPAGGRVFLVTSNEWDESVTWDTRPSIDGPLLGSFGPVSNGEWYEAQLTPSALGGDGSISLAIDSAEADGARWASREHVELPQLIVDVARVPGFIRDGLTEVAAPYIGSSNPTSFAGNHRLAVTQEGRQLAVHGRHAQGVQLAWRDPGGGWMMKTGGEAENGLLLGGSGTGDWVASIAVGRDPSGDEHAWAVWTGTTAQSTKTVQLRRLSDLDSPSGPTVGPLVTVSGAGMGNSKADLGFETATDGSLRGCVAWLQRIGASAWNVTAVWFTDLETDTPEFHDSKVLFTATSGGRYPTLVPAPAGMRLVVRNPSGRLQMFRHDARDPLTSWIAGARGVSVAAASVPAGGALSSGEILAAVESRTTDHVVTVQRFAANGGSGTVDLQVTGYRDPSVATDGPDAWLVMIRVSDGFVVSRTFTPEAGWEVVDGVEIGVEGGGNHDWPNVLRQAYGRLRLIVRGPAGGSDQTAVLGLDRPL
jgi:hypothetical protein